MIMMTAAAEMAESEMQQHAADVAFSIDANQSETWHSREWVKCIHFRVAEDW